MQVHEPEIRIEINNYDAQYWTDISWLLAADEINQIYLYRVYTSNYFVYKKNPRNTFKLLTANDALSLYISLPEKHEHSKENAFPNYYGGIGLNTNTRYD